MIETDRRNLDEMNQWLKKMKDKPLFCDTFGQLTTTSDDNRVIWFSTRCTFWTDNWTKLSKTFPHGIPICPNCKAQGMQCKFKDWQRSVQRCEINGKPLYTQFILYTKEKCITQVNGKPIGAKTVYQVWFQQQNKGMKSLDQALNEGINNILDG